MLPNQENWKLCSKCAVLFYTGNAPCRANNGTHDLSGSSNYFIPINENAPGQKGWRWCKKCQGLTYMDEEKKECVGGGHHDFSESGWYVLCSNGEPRSQAEIGHNQWHWCKDHQLLCHDGNTSCAAGVATLAWAAATTSSRLR